MEIKTVGVLGCGLMGSGIAQISAAAGYKTIVREVDDIALDKGIGRIKKFLDDGGAQGKGAAGNKRSGREVADRALDKGMGRIKKFLDDGVAKGKVTAASRDTTLASLS